MGRLKPLILKGNIWEKQEEESPKQNFFKELFIRTREETIIDFASRMNHEYDTNGLEGFLKYKPYTETYFSELGTAHKWLQRRDAFHEYEDSKLFAQMDDIEQDRIIERFALKEDIEFEELTWLLSRVKNRDPKLTGGQFKDSTQGIRNLQDSRNIDREKPTDYNKQQIEGEVESTTNVTLDSKKIYEKDRALMLEIIKAKKQ